MMRGDISKGESNYTSDITKSQLRQMYELGAKNLVTKPGVTKIGTRGLSKFQAEQVFILSERAKKLGLEIVLVTEKLSDGDGRAVNALYMEGTNRVVLSLQSDLDLLLVHAGHEIFHWAKSQNKEMTQRLQNMVINVLKSDSRYDYEGIYNQVSAEYEGLSEEDILEEIAAQYMGVVFADESSIRKTVEEASEQERGFLKKVIDYLKDFIKSLKELIRIYGDRDKAVRAAVETPVEQLEYFAETFERILEETAAKKKPATDEGGVKASLKAIPTTEQINKNIEFVAKMNPVADLSGNEFQKSDEDLITQVEKYFVSLGGKVSNYYGEIELRRKGIKSSIGHGIGRNKAVAFKAVPDVLKKGKIIDYQKNWKNRGYDTVVFAAPVSIAGQEYFMASVVIAEATKNDYYLHEVLLQKKEDEALFKTGTANGGTSGKATSPLFILLKKLNEVKRKNSVDVRYSVKRDVDGNKFVDVDPDLFDARDGESHAKTIARIIKDRFNNLISVNGQQIQINKTTNREWLRSESATYLAEKQPSLYLDKLKTIPYADEILKAANNWIGEKPNHKRKDDIVEFARGEVLYRVGNNGYIADVLVGIRSNGAAVLYSLKNIYEKEITDISLAMASESPQRSEEISVTDNISRTDGNVNKKYSRQRINESWEDIRTKMYENEVHEEIIGEIESYVKNIKKKKLTRETIITDGLIPKYEKIFDVARNYTRGSKVHTYELANAIHEMMWAAYDGDLDTKQFIATVRLFTEDIIRTGRKINDDKYRQYEDFCRMTR